MKRAPGAGQIRHGGADYFLHGPDKAFLFVWGKIGNNKKIIKKGNICENVE